MKKDASGLHRNRLSYCLWSFVLIWLAIGLAACDNPSAGKQATPISPTPPPSLTASPGPSPTPANCLVGTWEIKSKEDYLLASLPVGAFKPNELKFIGTVGSVGMRFFNDGTIAVQANQFMGRFDYSGENEVTLLDIKMNGFASGTYQLDGDQLKIDGLHRNEMTYESTLGQETMMSEQQASKFLPLFVEPYTTGTVDCSEQSLSIKILNFPNIQSPLEFVKLR